MLFSKIKNIALLTLLSSTIALCSEIDGCKEVCYYIDYDIFNNSIELSYDKKVTAEILIKDSFQKIYNSIDLKSTTNKEILFDEINNIFETNISSESMFLTLNGEFYSDFTKIIPIKRLVDNNSKYQETYESDEEKPIKTKVYTLKLESGVSRNNYGLYLITLLEKIRNKQQSGDKSYKKKEKELLYITQITLNTTAFTLCYKNKTVLSQRLYDDCFSLFSKTLKDLSKKHKFNYKDDLDCLKFIISKFASISSDEVEELKKEVEELKKEEVEKVFFQLKEQTYDTSDKTLEYNNNSQNTSSSYKLEIRHKDCNAGFDENLSFKSFFDKYMKKKTNNDKNEDPQDTSNNKLIIGSVFALVLACLGGIGFYIKQKLVNKKSTRNRLDLSNQEIDLGF